MCSLDLVLTASLWHDRLQVFMLLGCWCQWHICGKSHTVSRMVTWPITSCGLIQLSLNISKYFGDSGSSPMSTYRKYYIAHEINRHVTDDLKWPWEVSVTTQTHSALNISITVQPAAMGQIPHSTERILVDDFVTLSQISLQRWRTRQRMLASQLQRR